MVRGQPYQKAHQIFGNQWSQIDRGAQRQQAEPQDQHVGGNMQTVVDSVQDAGGQEAAPRCYRNYSWRSSGLFFAASAALLQKGVQAR